MQQQVLASTFNDSTGCYDNDLNDGGLYFAELSTNPGAQKGWDFAALGGLPKFCKLKITYHNKNTNSIKSVIAYKGDKGRGGPNLPQIDLHVHLANALGFPYPGLDYVTIEGAN